MERWYALYTVQGREQEAAELLERAVRHDFWNCCGIPRKAKVFRSRGILHIVEDVMFPGYLFVQSDDSEGLSNELKRAKKFPQLIGDSRRLKDDILTPIEKKDLNFLQDVCGDNLQSVMGITQITLDEENKIIQANGVLDHYRDHIIKLNLHKRFAIVEIELFNRTQAVLFGVKFEQDRAV